MAKDQGAAEAYAGPVRRLLTGLVVLVLIGIFLLWRIDSPRAERL
ncbi:MAG: rod shape-determining protein MreC, partial [Pseudomonadota bacterium]